jgi:hypothetical protein
LHDDFAQVLEAETGLAFSEEPLQTLDSSLKYSVGEVTRAWSPFIIMTLFIIAWGLDPVKSALNSIGFLKFEIPGLHDAIYKPDGTPLAIKPFDFNYLSAPELLCCLLSIIAVPLLGVTYTEAAKIYWTTLKPALVFNHNGSVCGRIRFYSQLFGYVDRDGRSAGEYRGIVSIFLANTRMARRFSHGLRYFFQRTVLQASIFFS